MDIFNKVSAGFLIRFAVILTLSFGIFIAIDYFQISDTEEEYMPASAGRA